MGDTGYIKIHRKITKWRWWGNTTAMGIWLYLLMNANWKDAWWGAGKIQVKRGEMVTSQRKLAEDLKLNRRTISKYLEMFEQDGQIRVRHEGRNATVIELVNYEKYQEEWFSNAPPSTPPDAPPSTPPSAHNRRIEKKNKKKEEERRETVSPTLSEVMSYVAEKRMSFDPEKFYNYYTDRNWKGITDWHKKADEWERSEHRWSGGSKKKDVLPDYMESEKKLEAFKKKLKEERKQ